MLACLFDGLMVISLCSQLDEPESTANTMKRSVSSFLGQVSSVLNPSPDDDNEEAIVIRDSQPVVLTKLQVIFCQLFT